MINMRRGLIKIAVKNRKKKKGLSDGQKGMLGLAGYGGATAGQIAAVRSLQGATKHTPEFQGAVQLLEKKLKDSGGEIRRPSFKLTRRGGFAKAGPEVAHYHPTKKYVQSPAGGASAIHLHELGHSTMDSVKGKTKLRRFGQKLRKGSALAGGMGAGLGGIAALGYAALGNAHKENHARNSALAGAGAASLRIPEELLANANAAKAIKKTVPKSQVKDVLRAYKKPTRKALATYLLAPVAAAGLNYGISKFRKHIGSAAARRDRAGRR